MGCGEPNVVHEAVDRARAAGAISPQIGMVTGDPKTAQTKYGGSHHAQRAYPARKRGQ